jgi:YVTN family beta-propeller protein
MKFCCGGAASLLIAGALAFPFIAFSGDNFPSRAIYDDVSESRFRQLQHLTPGTNLLFNGLGITPAGEHVSTGDLPLKIAIAPDKRAAIVVTAGFKEVGVHVIGLESKRETQYLPLPETFNGLAFSPNGKRFYVSGGSRGLLHVFKYSNGKAELEKSVNPNVWNQPALAGGAQAKRTSKPLPVSGELVFLAGIAVDRAGGEIYVCNEANNEVWALNPKTFRREATIGAGEHPHSCIIGADGENLYVSNWGSRSVSIIDVKTRHRFRDVEVGIRPNDLALAPDGRLFVACAGDNTVHVIGTAKLEKSVARASPKRRPPEVTREILSTSLYPESPEGSSPSALAISPDGKTLFVANSDQNSVMVADISGGLSEDAASHGERISVVNGFVPVGWYPSAVAVSPDNQFLLVGNGKGLASRPSWPAVGPGRGYKGVRYEAGGHIFEGSVSFIAKPDSAQMAAYTIQVRRNSSYRPEYLTRAPIESAGIVPTQPGQPCPIKYVLYIVKENRTYDQVLGDLKDERGGQLGNGDPHLAIFGENVTPNHHALARKFVLFDNLFSNSEVSADGHSWCDAAIATDFNQRSWIHYYSKHGILPGNLEMETPANGYLWDLCRRYGISFKTYGEGSRRVPSANRGQWPATRDTDRVQYWIADLKKAEQTGALPQFMIMSLGEDHTKGTKPGESTPEACVGDNDLALGRLVEAASHSKFWNQMAIFVIEDDTQNGPDHVDAHRTVGFVISPYCKPHFVDSTLYTTASMVRTMELLLGLPPLTQFDAGATPMFNAFQSSAANNAFVTLPPKTDLQARNTKSSRFAKESSGMNFSQYDLAPEDELNRILWYNAHPDEAYPTPVHRALFTTAAQ